MFDTVTLIGMTFGVTAVLYGLLSRNLGTAFVAGFFVGVVHAGLVALAVVQSGTGVAALPFSHAAGDLVMKTHQVPILKDGLDAVMQYFTVQPAQLAAYLMAGALLLMFTLVLFYLVKWALAGLVSAVVTKES